MISTGKSALRLKSYAFPPGRGIWNACVYTCSNGSAGETQEKQSDCQEGVSALS
jgi:hypothetical protein